MPRAARRPLDVADAQELSDVMTREQSLMSGHADLRFTGSIAVTATTKDELDAAVSQRQRESSETPRTAEVLGISVTERNELPIFNADKGSGALGSVPSSSAPWSPTASSSSSTPTLGCSKPYDSSRDF